MTASRTILRPRPPAAAGLALAIALCLLPYAGQAATVLMDTSMGVIHIELFDQAAPAGAPQTVANFLGYVDRGDYDNTIIHRKVRDFVVQGGGYTSLTPPPDGVRIDTGQPTVPNEFDASRSNVRGTIAMAKVPPEYDRDGNLIPRTGPDSATSEWFFNLADNSTTLDGLNGGFTVFGQVVDNGIDTVDAIAALPLFPGQRYGFSEVPSLNGSLVYVVRACVDDNLDSDTACTRDESQAAGTGDGNGDGTQDSVQDNVASVLNRLSNAVVTFAADPGMLFEIARAGSPNSKEFLDTFQPPGKFATFDQGAYQFAMTGAMDAAETVTAIHRVATPNGYYCYDAASASWQDFASDGSAEIQGDRIILRLVDGGLCDNDPAAGKINHLGVPANEFPRPAIGTIVRMETNLGGFNIGLYDSAALATVTNFLGYVNRGDYNNTIIDAAIAREIEVIRGGKYYFPDKGEQVPAGSSVANDFNLARPNVVGTIAMTKDSTDPDSATSGWFFNVSSNNTGTAEEGNLDRRNSGYTVFGEVLDRGMELVRAIAALPRPIFTITDFPDLPVLNPNTVEFVYVSKVCVNQDRDGVCSDFEDQAPNDGDGNTDDAKDRLQSNVSSFPNPFVNNASVTFAAREGLRLALARIPTTADLQELVTSIVPPPDTVLRFNQGAYLVILDGPIRPEGEEVTLIDRAVAPRTRYYAYKPATATEPASWYDFTFDGTTGAEIRGDRIILHLVDGGRGDNDGVAGQITHRGAPAAESPIPPPATDRGNDWGCTIAKRPRPLSQAADWGLVLAFLAFVFVRARGARV